MDLHQKRRIDSKKKAEKLVCKYAAVDMKRYTILAYLKNKNKENFVKTIFSVFERWPQ